MEGFSNIKKVFHSKFGPQSIEMSKLGPDQVFLGFYGIQILSQTKKFINNFIQFEGGGGLKIVCGAFTFPLNVSWQFSVTFVLDLNPKLTPLENTKIKKIGLFNIPAE